MSDDLAAEDTIRAAGDNIAASAKQPKAAKKTRRGSRPADRWLNSLLEPHKRTLSRKAWLDVAAGLMTIPFAYCLAGAVGALIIAKSGFAGTVPYAIGLFLSVLVRAGLSYIAGRLGHKVSAIVRRDLRTRLSTRLANHPPLDKDKHSAGEVAALGSDVIEAIDGYTSRYLSIKRQLAIIPLGIAAASAYISWAAALILLLCGPLVPVVMAIVGIRAKKASDDQFSALSDMSSRFLDRLSGMTSLRLFRAVGRTRIEFDTLANDYRKATMRVLRIAFLSSAALELFSALGIALTAIYAAYHYLGYIDYGSYGVPITLSTGLYLLLLAPEFFSPLREFSAAYHDKATAQSAADRLMHLLPLESLAETVETAQPTQNKQPLSIEGERAIIETVTFDQVALGYDVAQPPILEKVSCTLKRGEKIAILGASGSGKSTMLGALCGFLQPHAGTLIYNGTSQPSDPEGLAELRKSIAWIGQRPHIFHGSLLMNARLAKPEANRDDVTDALQKAHANHFVTQLPRNLLTILGETGFGISGGQVRRLAIARAMLTDASLVICDEPTADLDAETAALVTDSLMQVAEERLLVVATHDRTVAERCDRILYVHDGMVRALSHAELASLNEAALADGSISWKEGEA